MTIESNCTINRRWQTIVWTLRVTVALQCLGNWRWLTQIEETSLLSWMLGPTDIGGLAWSEPTALMIQQVVGWLTLIAGGLVLCWPRAVVLAPLVLLHTLITIAMWRMADGYALDVSWISSDLLTLFPFATQLARIAAPLGLLLCLRADEQPWRQPVVQRTMQLLRWAIAIVFVVHGIEAWQLNPKFLDLMINATYSVFGVELSQSTAERWLATIGVIDILIGIASISFRSCTAMWWMTAWGGVTAFSRVVATAWEPSWHEALTRIPHLGVPLSIVLWWHLLKCNSPATPPRDQ